MSVTMPSSVVYVTGTFHLQMSKIRHFLELRNARVVLSGGAIPGAANCCNNPTGRVPLKLVYKNAIGSLIIIATNDRNNHGQSCSPIEFPHEQSRAGSNLRRMMSPFFVMRNYILRHFSTA